MRWTMPARRLCPPRRFDELCPPRRFDELCPPRRFDGDTISLAASYILVFPVKL